jgi:hypothetical protein
MSLPGQHGRRQPAGSPPHFGQDISPRLGPAPLSGVFHPAALITFPAPFGPSRADGTSFRLVRNG